MWVLICFLLAGDGPSFVLFSAWTELFQVLLLLEQEPLGMMDQTTTLL